MSLLLYDCVRGSVWMNDSYSLLQLLFPLLLTASCWKVLTYSMSNSPSQGKGYENTSVTITQCFECRSKICFLQTTVICFFLTAHLQMRREKYLSNDLMIVLAKVTSLANISWLERLHICEGVMKWQKERKWNFTLFEQCCSIYMTKWGVSGNFNSCGSCYMCSVKHLLDGVSMKCSTKTEAWAGSAFIQVLDSKNKPRIRITLVDHSVGLSLPISCPMVTAGDAVYGEEHMSLGTICGLSTCISPACTARLRWLEGISLPCSL